MLIKIQDSLGHHCFTCQLLTVAQNHSKCMMVCNEVRKAFSSDGDNCVKYSSDNTNSMIGQRNSLLQKIRSAQGDQKIFDVVCPLSCSTFVCWKRSQKTFCKC